MLATEGQLLFCNKMKRPPLLMAEAQGREFASSAIGAELVCIEVARVGHALAL